MSTANSVFVIVTVNLSQKILFEIPILYHIMAKCCIKPNPNVLWAYKKELGFSRWTFDHFWWSFGLIYIKH